MKEIIRWVLCLIAVTFSLSARADIQADFSMSTASIIGKDTILVRKVSVPGYGTYDVNFKWNAASASLIVDDIKASIAKATELSIKGAIPVKEGSSVTLSAIAKFDDGSTATVSPIWSVDNPTVASISNIGIFTAKSIATDTVVNVTATYVDSGITLTSTQSITITNNPPVLASLAVSGPPSIDENSSVTLTTSAKMDDGSQTPVSPTWSVSPSSVASISSSGVLTAGSVTTNTPITVSAIYSLNGVTVTSRLNITINNKLLPVKICSGRFYSSSYFNEYNDALITVDPNSNTASFKLTAGASDAYFFYNSLYFIQNGNVVDMGTYAPDADTALWTGSDGWSGYGQIIAGTSKSAVASSFPSTFNLGSSFQIKYNFSSSSPTLITCN